jgi:nitrite reductase (NADH) small subunit
MSRANLGPVSLVPPGEGRTFRVGAVHLAVFHTREGAFHATAAACPHKGGPLADGLLGGSVVVCPLHARKFDVVTGARVDAEGEGLRTFPLEIVDGELHVECNRDCDAA